MSPSSDPNGIRRMRADDLPRVMECALQLEHMPHYSHATWRGMLDPAAAPSRVALVAAADAGEVHGFAVASVLGPQAELEIIAVSPASQRKGLGRRLLHAAMQELRASGVRELWLEVRESNQPAIALYCSAGFRETGRRSRYYIDPVEDALLMDLPLI